jgi:hypothetical protein
MVQVLSISLDAPCTIAAASLTNRAKRRAGIIGKRLSDTLNIVQQPN